MIALGLALATCGALVLCMVRVLLGPTLYDRVIAANGACLCAVVVAAAVSIGLQDVRVADVAIALLLALIVANTALFKFSHLHTFQTPAMRLEDEL